MQAVMLILFHIQRMCADSTSTYSTTAFSTDASSRGSIEADVLPAAAILRAQVFVHATINLPTKCNDYSHHRKLQDNMRRQFLGYLSHRPRPIPLLQRLTQHQLCQLRLYRHSILQLTWSRQQNITTRIFTTHH